MFAAVYATIGYFITEQPPEQGRYLKFVLVYVLATISADGFGILLGTLVNPVVSFFYSCAKFVMNFNLFKTFLQNGTFFGAVSSCFMIVFSGFLVLFKHMPVFMRYISDLSLHKYCLEALVVAMYGNGRKDIACPPETMYCHYSKAETILKELGMDGESYYSNIVKIMVQLLLFKILSYFTLRRRLLKG